MNILKEVLKNEVFPALGCTEPIAVACAASIAASHTTEAIEKITITVDPRVYKNGFAVIIPNTGFKRGNLIAGVLGALIKRPDLKMEILKALDEKMIAAAEALIKSKQAVIRFDKSKLDLYIEVVIKTKTDTIRAVIENSHTNLVRLEKNNRSIFEGKDKRDALAQKAYKAELKKMTLADFVDLAEQMDADDEAYIKQGITMNMLIADAGKDLKKVGYYIADLVNQGYIVNDVFAQSKILTAAATDARMAGLNYPVMSSGGSGNQGIVAILVPYNVGVFFKIEEKKIIRSIALSHLINSYIKCFTGDLSPLCGCSIAAGVSAAAAIVYQHHGKDTHKITLAVNNLVSDLGGMLCDGAKEGCALKVASSADSAIRAAYMAINNHGITETEGFVGRSAEETIYNLSEISIAGMAKVDDTMLGIMMEKENSASTI
ncbi:MAG: serine dehydratase subunit alpha family protein [Deltaproteobacteria bacterium]|nr:serine dehydratase subunit alpha family protein [Deltaproteobacteria bacterium]